MGRLILSMYFKLAFLKSFISENYRFTDQDGSLEESYGIEKKQKCNKSCLRHEMLFKYVLYFVKENYLPVTQFP